MLSFGGYLTGTALLLALWVWRIVVGDWFSAIFLTVPFAWFAGRALVESGFGLPMVLRKLVLGRWQGLYFEYRSRHLRAVRRGDALLFYERDILGVLGLKQSREAALFADAERVMLGRGAGHALTRAGCNRLLRKSAHPDARPLLLHLEREAFAPFAKRLEYERLERSPPAALPAAAEPPGEPVRPSLQDGGRDGTAEGRPKSSDSAAR